MKLTIHLRLSMRREDHDQSANLEKGSERGTRGSRHRTGIYGANEAGEAMPPMYCYDSSARDEENFQMKLSWVEVIPKVRGRYGCPNVETYDSFASVC